MTSTAARTVHAECDDWTIQRNDNGYFLVWKHGHRENPGMVGGGSLPYVNVTKGGIARVPLALAVALGQGLKMVPYLGTADGDRFDRAWAKSASAC